MRALWLVPSKQRFMQISSAPTMWLPIAKTSQSNLAEFHRVSDQDWATNTLQNGNVNLQVCGVLS